MPSDSGALRDLARLSAARLSAGGEVGSWQGERNGRVEVPEEPSKAEMAETVHDPVRRVRLGARP